MSAPHLETYDLRDGRLLWSSNRRLRTLADSWEQTVIEDKEGLRFFWWTGATDYLWQRVDLRSGVLERFTGWPPAATSRDEADLRAVSGDALYCAADGQAEVKVLDPVTHALIKTLHTDQPVPGDRVHVAAGVLDDGRPVLITYAAGVLRGWLRDGRRPVPGNGGGG